MKAAELRQSILQAAVQGKLVPQNPHDEPASELLKRIQKEKARLTREGKIKKEKPLPPIAEEDLPFDLPDGWVWCRLNDIAVFITSGSRDWAKYYSNNGAVFLRMGNLSKDSFNLRLNSIQYVSPPNNSEGNRTKLEINDLLVSITGEVGLLGRIPANFQEAYINQHTALVRFPDELQDRYFPYTFLSPLCKNQFNEPQRGIKNSFRLTDLSFMYVPLPPIQEQRRIVAKVDELMALCDNLEEMEKALNDLETRFAEFLPKSILQAAVQGKLVPQNVHDEPASELLKRIQKDKARLVKEGKIKKEKHLPPITEDEITYDLPDGWARCRLGELAILISGRDLETNQFNNEMRGLPYITGASAIEGNKILINRWTETPIVVSKKNDLLLTCKGTVGKLIFNNIGDCHVARQIMAIRMFTFNIHKDYIRLFLDSYVVQLNFRAKSMIPGISREDVLFAILPIPPLKEQERIVAKVDELNKLNSEIESAKVSVLKGTLSNVVPIYPIENLDEFDYAARGDGSQGLSSEALKDANELFED